MLAWSLTFVAVVVSWVVFRAKSLAGAGAILAGMFGANGVLSWGDYRRLKAERSVQLARVLGLDQV